MTNPSFRFTTCSKSLVPEAVVTIDASHVVSLLDPGEPLERPSRISAVNHLRLDVRDVSDPFDIGAPRRDQVEALLQFGQRLPPGGGVVVHCHAGISRSTAAAFTLLTQDLGDAERALALLTADNEWADPNRLIVKYADDLLGAGGRMVRLIRALRDRPVPQTMP
jgi:predicted protein tyrosine phosphatase